MSFIGVISDNKTFDIVKKKLLKNIEDNKMNLINITRKNIENMKNIKFETIIINNDLSKFKEKEIVLEKICTNAKFIILNSDINLKIEILKKEKVNIITYGLNQKATITISSITQSNILICLQRNIENVNKYILEVEERHIELDEKEKIKPYEILIIYTIFMIYGYKIMDQI